jgi:hypothetical protein
LPYASTEPKILQNPAFLNSKTAGTSKKIHGVKTFTYLRQENLVQNAAKHVKNVVISMLQGQQMKLVVTQCFNTNFYLFDSKRDGKVHYESEIFKDNLSCILKKFTIELSYGKSRFKSVGPESGSRF